MRFRRNPLFESELKSEPEYKAALHEQGREAKRRTEAIAPRGPTGMYRRSIELEWVAGSLYLRTTDFAGHMVEWGSANNRPYAPIRRGVRAAGLKLRELPKP